MLSTKDLPIIYMNQDPARRKLQPQYASPYMIIKFGWPNAVEWELLTDIMIDNTVDISKLTKYQADRVGQQRLPPSVRTV